MHEAAKKALENYIFGEKRDGRMLRVALLTRDISSLIETRIISDFIKSLDSRLCDKRVPSGGDLPKSFARFTEIKWRSQSWGKGWFVGIGFDESKLSKGGWGLCAPDAEAAKSDPKKAQDFDILDGKLRGALQTEIRNAKFRSGPPESSPWWPSSFDVPGLKNWLETEFLLKAAGAEPHEGMPLVEWLADELSLLYHIVDKVLSEKASQ